MISKSRIKLIKTLEKRKYRLEHKLFVAEGPKLVGELIQHLKPAYIAAQKEWIERLMEFVNMPDEQRSKAVKEYVENKRMSEEFRELFSPYFETLNRLNILSW